MDTFSDLLFSLIVIERHKLQQKLGQFLIYAKNKKVLDEENYSKFYSILVCDTNC